MSKSIAIMIFVLLTIGSLLIFSAEVINQGIVCLKQIDFKNIILEIWNERKNCSKSYILNITQTPCLSVSLPLTY